MADFAPNFTARVRFKYRAVGRIHHLQVRVPTQGSSGVNIDAAITKMGAFFGALSANLSDDFIILAVDFAAENSTVFLPASSLSVTGSAPLADLTTNRKRAAAQHLSFVGRSTAGQRAIFFLYGYIGKLITDDADDIPDDFRYFGAEQADIQDATGVLNSSEGILLCANDGVSASWSRYANAKYNDFWVGKTRQGV